MLISGAKLIFLGVAMDINFYPPTSTRYETKTWEAEPLLGSILIFKQQNIIFTKKLYYLLNYCIILYFNILYKYFDFLINIVIN
jgi:hypothetical protein